jgi:hypothetical protein
MRWVTTGQTNGYVPVECRKPRAWWHGDNDKMNPNLRATLVALALLTAAQPAAAIDHPYPPFTLCQQDLYAPMEEAIVACLTEAAQNPNTNPPPTPGTGALGAALAPADGDDCYWPGFWYIERGDTEDKWTPLYGANSPEHGRGDFKTSSTDGFELDISLTFRGVGAQMSYERSAIAGKGLGAEKGQSRVNYQYVSWTEFTGYRCEDYYKWRVYGPWLWPTDYEPGGYKDTKVGYHEGGSLWTDWDNPMYPTNSGFTQGTTIGVDMAYYTKDQRVCPGTTEEYYEFGKSSVFKVGARIEFKGAFETGGAYIHGEVNTFQYTYTGCYWVDYLGDSDHDVGWAFHSDPYHYPNGECRPEYQRECDAENHVPERDESALEVCNTGSSPLGYGATSQVCQPARPSPCEVLGGSLRSVFVDVNALQQAWLKQVNPTPESKADLLKTLCEGETPIECGDLCQDPCAEVAGLGNGDPCVTVQQLVPDACQLAGGLCRPTPCGDEASTTASTPLCDPEWSAYGACDWSATGSLDGNPARDLACEGDYPEPEPVCTYVGGITACPPACQGTCAIVMEAVGQADACNEQAPPGAEYAWDVACGREDFDACEAGYGIEDAYPCGGRSPLDPE